MKDKIEKTIEPEVAEVSTTDVAISPRHRVRISNEEWFDISLALECHHAVFYKLWAMGRPIFNEDIETACVQFDENGDFIWFHFNPKFWRRLDFYNKLFVICHEALHIVLNHGIRTRDAGRVNNGATNAALDVVVNHLLCRGFGFEREKIEGWQDYCWVDTVFANRPTLPPDNESYEYYYNLFEKVYGLGGPGDGESGPGTVDDHAMMGSGSDKIIDELNEGLSDEERETLKDMVNKHFQKGDVKKSKPNTKAGTGTGGQWVFASTGKIKKKKKWETVIKRWSKKYLIPKDKEIEQWARLNRRLAMLPKDMFLPSEMEIEDEDREKTRISVYFFMDTSGSCWGLKDRFFAAVESLDPKRFDVRLLCFDTTVQETTLASKKIYGGGGTSFNILEKFIQQDVAAGKPYPKAVFVMTDGYGDTIKPEKPDRWYWFLTEGGSRSCIDRNCIFHNLGDFE